jgi:DNA adenine methylase
MKAKPFLKWVGGKKQLLPDIKNLMPKSFNKYFEPFLGGGAVFFSIAPKVAYLNDINKTLIYSYINIRDSVENIIAKLKDIEKKYKKKNSQDRKDFYYLIRNQFNLLNTSRSLEKTIYLIFLNKTCFNGLYRVNSKGEFNVPFGKYSNPTICDEDNLRFVSKALNKIKLISSNFEEAVDHVGENDFVYFDPPYYPLNRTSSFTSYSKNCFLEKEQIKLRDTFDLLVKRKAYVMLSNSNTKFIREIYENKGYKIHEVNAKRSINSKADKRGKITELIITNYN